MLRPVHFQRRARAGFTLVEAMLSVLIVGLGVVAMMMVFGSGTRINAYGNNLSTAVFLSDEMRAMTDDVSFDELLNFDNTTYNGVDANGNPVDGLANYQQSLSVQAVNPTDLTQYIGPDPEAVILTATVSYQGEQVSRISWLRTW